MQSGPSLTGTLAAQRQAAIRAQIAGSVLTVTAEPGQAVRRGETLARLDSAALTDAYNSARSAVTSARNNLDVAQREAQRQRTLVAAGAVAQRNVETSQQTVVQAQAALAQARSQLASAEKQLGYTVVTAPFSGVVSERPVSAGDVVQPGTALYTVVDPSSLQLEAAVPAEQLGQLRVGAPVEFTVTGYGNRTFRGRDLAHQPERRSHHPAGAGLRRDPQPRQRPGGRPLRRGADRERVAQRADAADRGDRPPHGPAGRAAASATARWSGSRCSWGWSTTASRRWRSAPASRPGTWSSWAPPRRSRRGRRCRLAPAVQQAAERLAQAL